MSLERNRRIRLSLMSNKMDFLRSTCYPDFIETEAIIYELIYSKDYDNLLIAEAIIESYGKEK